PRRPTQPTPFPYTTLFRSKVTLSGRSFETSRRIPEQVFASGKNTIVEDLMDTEMAPLHAGTVALGIRHVLCTPLRLVRYVERARSEEHTSELQSQSNLVCR